MDMYVKSGGVWTKVETLWVRQSGAWVPIKKAFSRQSGAWSQFYQLFTVDMSGLGNSLSASAIDPSDATAQIVFETDGQVSKYSNLSLIPASWGSPTTAGIGSQYEVKATLLSGSTPSGTLNSWLPLSTSRGWSISRTSIGSASTTLRFEIRKAGTTSVLDTHDITLSANVSGQA